MAYRPLLLNGPLLQIVIATLSGVLGLLATSALVVGYLLRKNSVLDSVLLGVAALGLFLPHLGANVIGLFILVGIYILQKRNKVTLVS